MRKARLLRKVYKEVTGEKLDIEPSMLKADFHVYRGAIKLPEEQIKKILLSHKRRGEIGISKKKIEEISEKFIHEIKKS